MAARRGVGVGGGRPRGAARKRPVACVFVGYAVGMGSIDWFSLLGQEPDRGFVREPGTEGFTRAEAAHLLATFVGGLDALEVAPGVRIGVTMGTLEAAFFAAAAMFSGRVPVLLDPALPPRARAEAATRLGLGTIVLGGAPDVPGVPALGDDTFLTRLLDATPRRPDPVDADAEAAVLLTSGTSGAAKAVRLPHRALYASTRAYLAPPWSDCGDVYASAAGLRTISGFRMGMLVPAVCRVTTVVLPPAGQPLVLLALASEAGATVLNIGPAFVTACLRAPDRARAAIDRGRLRAVIGSGAAVPAAERVALAELLGVHVAWWYGLTEVAGPTAAAWAHPDGRVDPGDGLPVLPVRVVSPDGRALPAGELGEIELSGERTMLGYVGGPEVTVVRTRDAGHVDAAGNLHVRGRIDRMYTDAAGEKVLLDEAEAVMRTALGRQVHLDVVEAPRPLLALLVEDDAPPPGWQDAARAAIAQVVAPRGVPRRLVATPRLPRNAGGKVDVAEACRLLLADD